MGLLKQAMGSELGPCTGRCFKTGDKEGIEINNMEGNIERLILSPMLWPVLARVRAV